MVSICIPFSPKKSSNTESLKQLLESLCNQSYRRFEVIISSAIPVDSIQKELKETNLPLDIRFVKNEADNSSEASLLNEAIKEAKYPIIKPILPDALVINDKMIGKIIGAKGKWGAVSRKLSEKNKTITPRWTNNILAGNNKLGNISGVYFEMKEGLIFDDKLTHLTDVDLYYRLHEAYGTPFYINDTCLASHISDQKDPNLWHDDIRYLSEKHNLPQLEKKFRQRLFWKKYTSFLKLF